MVALLDYNYSHSRWNGLEKQNFVRHFGVENGKMQGNA